MKIRRLPEVNGVFTYFLAHGWLGEADVDPADGKVTADELVSYVRRGYGDRAVNVVTRTWWLIQKSGKLYRVSGP